MRKGSAWSRATLVRGERAALQVRLGAAPMAQRPRLDLVFLVDATGSMGDEIAKLKSSMRAMSQQISQLPGQPDICYGLVAYRDRGDAFLTRTHDFTDELGAFQSVLARVQAGGGGDTPEALNEALHETVHGLSWRTEAARMVVLVADAPPHLDYGGPQYDLDMQAALAKGIKLFAVGASGLASRRAEVAKSAAPSAMPAAPGDAAERESDLAAPASIAPRQRPRHETVTAGLVDDNADFGEYLAYRQRNAGLPVRCLLYTSPSPRD